MLLLRVDKSEDNSMNNDSRTKMTSEHRDTHVRRLQMSKEVFRVSTSADVAKRSVQSTYRKLASPFPCRFFIPSAVALVGLRYFRHKRIIWVRIG